MTRTNKSAAKSQHRTNKRAIRTLGGTIAELERAQLVHRATDDESLSNSGLGLSYLFKHAMTQETAYGTLLLKRRAGVHRAVAAAYERLFTAQLDELAPLLGRHWAAAGDYDRAAHYFVRAGDAAARLFAPVEARWHYAQALATLERLPDSDDNHRLLIEATTRFATVAFGSEAPDQILKRLLAAESLGRHLTPSRKDKLLRAQLRSWIGRMHIIINQPLEGIKDYEQVLAEAKEMDERELMAISSGEIGLARVRLGQYGGAEELLSPAIAHYEKIANWQQWTYLVAHLAMSKVARGHIAEGFADGERMLSRANLSNAPSAIAVSNLFLSFIYLLGGEAGRSLAATEACIQLAQKTGELLLYNMAHGFHAWAATLLGDQAMARESLLKQDETARQLGGQFVLPEQFAAMHAVVAANQGLWEEAAALAQQAIAIAEPLGGIFGQGLAERVLAQSLAAAKPPRWDEAEAQLAASLKAFETGECTVEAARTQAAWGKLCQGRGYPDEARKHLGGAADRFQASHLERELGEVNRLIVELQEARI